MLTEILKMLVADLRAGTGKFLKWLETSNVKIDNEKFLYDESSDTYPLLREIMEKIKSEAEVNFPGSFRMEYYDTWKEETEFSEPYNFYWLGKKLPKKSWLPAGCEIWFKILVGFFEYSQKSGKIVFYHIENEEIRGIVENNMRPYLERFNIDRVVEF